MDTTVQLPHEIVEKILEKLIESDPIKYIIFCDSNKSLEKFCKKQDVKDKIEMIIHNMFKEILDKPELINYISVRLLDSKFLKKITVKKSDFADAKKIDVYVPNNKKIVNVLLDYINKKFNVKSMKEVQKNIISITINSIVRLQ